MEILNINTIHHLDFEISAHKAVLFVLPNVKIMTCRFHLRQSWWRKVSDNINIYLHLFYYFIIFFLD